MIEEDQRGERQDDSGAPEDEQEDIHQRARLTLAGQARDTEELKMLLEMLGLHPAQDTDT
ncbi:MULTISPECIES: hypothetical protein [unclassified Streptomyces]|uniref:hypothetical protein n=1 Tax=unclassified Streptomyces TaxID=2593676 RepID=UPI00382EB27E